MVNLPRFFLESKLHFQSVVFPIAFKTLIHIFNVSYLNDQIFCNENYKKLFLQNLRSLRLNFTYFMMNLQNNRFHLAKKCHLAFKRKNICFSIMMMTYWKKRLKNLSRTLKID